MERVSFEIERQEVADALHAEAAAHGRSVADELADLVERTYTPGSSRRLPHFPAGLEPMPGENFVDHITRISRPGFEFEIERDRMPHEGFNL